MPDFLIRDLDETTMRSLKQRAEANARSLQAEIRDTLRRSVKMSREEFLERSDRWVSETADREMLDVVAIIRRHRDAWRA